MPKEDRKGEERNKSQKGKKQIVAQNPTISIITLNIYGTTNGSI